MNRTIKQLERSYKIRNPTYNINYNKERRQLEHVYRCHGVLPIVSKNRFEKFKSDFKDRREKTKIEIKPTDQIEETKKQAICRIL